MAELFKVNAPVRKPLFEGVQGENEARSIQFDITPWVDELGDGAVTATAKRPQDSQPYPVTVTKDGTTVTWKPTSTDTAFAGVGSFQLEYTVDSVLAKTCIWSTMVAPSLDPAGDPPDPYDNWLAEMRQIAADAIQAAQDAEQSAQDAADEVENAQAEVVNAQNEVKNAEAWAVGQRGGVDVPSTDPTYENNAKYWAEQSLANQYGAFITKTASGDIPSFADGGDNVPMKSLKVAIVPKQSGSGDPSPDNVRPITGWTGANVFVTGKNLLDPTYRKNEPYSSSKNIRFYFYDGTYHGGLLVKKGVTYTLKSSGSTKAAGVYIKTETNTNKFIKYNATEITFTPEEDFLCAVDVCYNVEIDVSTINCQLEVGATATDYVPYNGHTTPVPFGQTVYEGTLDVGTGELTITHGGAVYNGSENWGVETQGGTTSFYVARQSDAQPVAQIQGGDVFTSICPVTTETWQAGKMRITSRYYNFLLGSALGISTAEQFKTYLASNPISLCYKLATPTTVQLAPAQVATLLGTNNVWSDAGAVSVEYRADPTLAYAELQALILENM